MTSIFGDFYFDTIIAYLCLAFHHSCPSDDRPTKTKKNLHEKRNETGNAF